MFRDFKNIEGIVVERAKRIPKIPKTEEELLTLLSKNRKHIRTIDSQIAPPGGVSHYSILFECPFCHSRYIAERSEGCFNSTTFPLDCPVCRFPGNVLEEFKKLREITTGNFMEKSEGI